MPSDASGCGDDDPASGEVKQAVEAFNYLKQLSAGDEFVIPDRATPFEVDSVTLNPDGDRPYAWDAHINLIGKRGGEYQMVVTKWDGEKAKLNTEIRRLNGDGRYAHYTGSEIFVEGVNCDG